ncbi:MAG: hypothetical protein U0228_08935 [Myxococcaceae bacterium]
MRSLVAVLVLTSTYAAAATPSLVGWWRSDELCLELFANGDFELSTMPSGAAKQQALGTASLAADGKSVTLRVQRIWAARFVTNCRKANYPGHWVDTQSALGVELKTGQATQLTLKRLGDDRLEVCATSCATLHREAPRLRGAWRRADMDSPTQPKRPWAPGDLLQLELSDTGGGSELWIGAADGKFDTVQGTMTVQPLDADRFKVELDHKRTLQARRLAGEKLELCEGKNCATLERQFDSDHYELF